MKRARLVPVLAALSFAGFSSATPSRAAPDAAAPAAASASAPLPSATPVMTGADAERRAKIAVTVGTRHVTVGEVEDHLAELPPFQAERYGATRDEIVHAYVEQVLVRDLLLGAGAEQKKLDASYPTKSQLLRAKSGATLRALRNANGGVRSPTGISMEEIAAYYESHRSHFEGPERVNLWRILCKTRDEALTVIGEAKRDLTVTHFTELARQHSIDKATYLRGGNLGFLGPDGASNEAGVKVDPALLHAAGSTRDGDLVTEPAAESGGYAVIWRRTTVPATKRSLDDAAGQIRTTLFREKTEAAEKKLIEDLRAKNVKDVDADLLKIVELPIPDAGFSLPRSIPSGPASGHPAPDAAGH